MVFKIIAKTRFQHVTHYNIPIVPVPIIQLLDSLKWDLFTWKGLSSLAFLGYIGIDLDLIETEIFGKLVVENSVTISKARRQ